MLSQAIAAVLPAAAGVALSPIPIVAVILMLGTPRARSNGVAFAIGWVAGLVIVSVVVLTVTGGTSDPDSTASTSVGWGKVVVGALFFMMAARQWRKRPKPGEQPEMPAWMATVDDISAPKSLGLGLLLSGANPKNLALTAAAAASIAAASIDAGQETLAVALFVVLASVTVVGSVLAYLFARRATENALARMKDFMIQHNAVIMFVLLVVLGAKLIGDGIGGLGS